jgi:NAD(P)-dependent dehydrogenase (short-subunit alcohol dehydrogenase family)
MSKLNWNTQNIADQTNRTILITGATSGLGKEASKILSEKNAKIIMAVRNTKKAENVAEEIKKQHPDAQLDIREMDLSSLQSVRNFAEGVKSDYGQIDILINNAGIMACPFDTTDDNIEIQMGTNHLGHFALTGLVMPLLKKT